MRETGWLLIATGLLAVIGAFVFVTVGVDVGYMPGSEYLPAMPHRVANVHAMHIQALVFHGGLIAFLAGVICTVGAEIKDAIARSGGAISPVAAAGPVADEPAEAEKLGNGVAIALAFGIVAVLVIGIIATSSKSGAGSYSYPSNNAAADTAAAMQNAEDAMNAANAEIQNTADQVSREVEAAARRAARGR